MPTTREVELPLPDSMRQLKPGECDRGVLAETNARSMQLPLYEINYVSHTTSSNTHETLDPADWSEFAGDARTVLDEMIEHLRSGRLEVPGNRQST
jgi:hypothetical protein